MSERLAYGTQLVNGPAAGRTVLGINASRAGETFTIGGHPYKATGKRTASDYWEAIYDEKPRRRLRRKKR